MACIRAAGMPSAATLVTDSPDLISSPCFSIKYALVPSIHQPTEPPGARSCAPAPSASSSGSPAHTSTSGFPNSLAISLASGSADSAWGEPSSDTRIGVVGSAVKGIFDEMKRGTPKNHCTIGINDDVTHTSLDYDPHFTIEDRDMVQCVFWGLGSDGTVSANKNSIKIIGEETDNYAQGYFVYDSKKSGSITVSHLRFGKKPIHSTYLISRANFVACHQFGFLERFDVLKAAEPGATFLLNSPYGPDEVWDHLPRTTQEHIVNKKLRFYVIDGVKVAREAGMGGRINTVMQTCFFALSGVLPRDEAVRAIKQSIEKTYGKRGETIVQKNFAAVDRALDNLHEVAVPQQVSGRFDIQPPVPPQAPEFIRNVTARIIAGEGDLLPVSAFSPDGTFPSGTAQWEKRNIALEIPVWDSDLCIQCGKCVLVCPHSVIRAKVYHPKLLENAPAGFKSSPARWKDFKDLRYTLAVAPEDCTGCSLCV